MRNMLYELKESRSIERKVHWMKINSLKDLWNIEHFDLIGSGNSERERELGKFQKNNG